jgi:ABC-type sugar transport system ATPase subunit
MSPSENTTGADRAPALVTKGISKAYGHVQALDRVDFELYPGEVAALVGDNGAGKSTLVKILSGVYQADSGEIYIEGRRVDIRQPSDATGLGIATVYQELTLVPNRDVASNIYLGREPRRWAILIDRKKMWRAAQQVMNLLHVDLPSVKVNVAELSGGQRQAVAIGRALGQGGRYILMDEPTAALGVEQTRMVKDLIVDLTRQGHAVLMITHNMEHVFDIADRVIVLRHGRRVGSLMKAETSREEIVGLITGAIRGNVD